MTDTVRCEFRTTVPEGALRQAVKRGTQTRYRRCKNKATQTITFTEASGRWIRERTVNCCSLHKRLHETNGWLP